MSFPRKMSRLRVRWIIYCWCNICIFIRIFLCIVVMSFSIIFFLRAFFFGGFHVQLYICCTLGVLFNFTHFIIMLWVHDIIFCELRISNDELFLPFFAISYGTTYLLYRDLHVNTYCYICTIQCNIKCRVFYVHYVMSLP